MEVPPDVSQMASDPQMDMRMMQQQGQPGAPQGPPGAPGAMGMMPPDGMIMTQSGAPGMAPYYVAPPHLQHPQYLPPQTMQQPGHGSGGKARLQCHACSKLLEYDAGAQYVQCFSCSTMNSVQQKTQVGGRVLSMLCAMCNTTNLAPYGVNYVRCGTCHTISQVSHAYRVELQSQQGPQGGAMPQGQRGGYPYGTPDQMQQAAMMQMAGQSQMQGVGVQQHGQGPAGHVGGDKGTGEVSSPPAMDSNVDGKPSVNDHGQNGYGQQ